MYVYRETLIQSGFVSIHQKVYIRHIIRRFQPLEIIGKNEVGKSQKNRL
jgi:hypothetical protein